MTLVHLIERHSNRLQMSKENLITDILKDWLLDNTENKEPYIRRRKNIKRKLPKKNNGIANP